MQNRNPKVSWIPGVARGVTNHNVRVIRSVRYTRSILRGWFGKMECPLIFGHIFLENWWILKIQKVSESWGPHLMQIVDLVTMHWRIAWGQKAQGHSHSWLQAWHKTWEKLTMHKVQWVCTKFSSKKWKLVGVAKFSPWPLVVYYEIIAQNLVVY